MKIDVPVLFYQIDGILIMIYRSGEYYEYYARLNDYDTEPFQFFYAIIELFSEKELRNMVKNGYFDSLWEEV